MIKKYKSKPKTIEAIEYTGANQSDVEQFIGHALIRQAYTRGLKILTLAGLMTASKGDYIVKDIQGEFYPVKPEIFHKCYTELKVLITP